MSDRSDEPDTRASLFGRLREQPSDGVAWVEFVRRYGPMVEAWCRRWGLQSADADDVTQMVLSKLAARMQRFQYDPTRRFRGFLRTVTRNVWADYVDEMKRAPIGMAPADLAVLDSLNAREDFAARMEETFDQELMDIAFIRVRARVEPHTWEAFRLTALECQSGIQVAATLQMQVATVFKARSKVQKMLREELDQLEAALDR